MIGRSSGFVARATCSAYGIVLALLLCCWTQPASAYLKFGYEVNGKPHTLKWSTGKVQYFVTDAGVDGVSATQFQAAVAKAFDVWAAVPTASISYQFGGFTRSLPDEDDGRTTLGFLNEPSLDRVLASTSYLIDDLTGDLVESDIFFNSAFPWSVAAAGERTRWDLQSIATHEIGHALVYNGFVNQFDGTYNDQFRSTFDYHINFHGSEFTFTGDAAQAWYGGPVPLSYGNVFHWGNQNGSGAELEYQLMNGIVFHFGHRYLISNLDRALLSDCGLPLRCRGDFNADDALDFFDYLDFVDAFSSGSPIADFNSDDVIDFFDYLDFVDAFSTGC